MPLRIIISHKAYTEIRKYYTNVARKFCNTYSLNLMLKNIRDARLAMYRIENGLSRRKPKLSRWKGLYMASYMVNGKTRWNYAYRIEENTVYVEDACHAQNMSEFTPSIPILNRTKYRRLTKKPLFGYSYVMNDKKEYNLIDNNGKLITQWFKAIKPFQQPYGKYQIIANINVGGWFCALGYDGTVYNLHRTWRDMCSENKYILQTDSFKKLITEIIDANNMYQIIRLTETEFKQMLVECITKIINEIAQILMKYNCKVTCPYCKDSIDLIDMPQSLEEMKENNITGKCWNCKQVFLMADAVSDFVPHLTT